MSEDGATDVAADGDGAESGTPTRTSLRRRLQRMDPERFDAPRRGRVGAPREGHVGRRRPGRPRDRRDPLDGEALLGPIETLDGWAVVVTYFDDLERREHDDRGVGSSIEAEAGDTSLRQRLRGAVGSLFS